MTIRSLRESTKSSIKHVDANPQKILLNLWLSSSKAERGERFIDTKAAAQLIGVSQRAVRLWIESGYVHAVLIGKKYHILLQSLKRFLLTHALGHQ